MMEPLRPPGRASESFDGRKVLERLSYAWVPLPARSLPQAATVNQTSVGPD